MSSKARSRGRRLENLAVEMLKERGIPAERVPFSGQLKGILPNLRDDIVIGSIKEPLLRGEAKFRQNINGQLWEWLEDVDFVVLKRNYKEPIVLIPFDQFVVYVEMRIKAMYNK